MWSGVCGLVFVFIECIFCVCWFGYEVFLGFIEIGYLLIFRLFVILDGCLIFIYVWNWFYNIIVIEVIIKIWC